MALEWTDFLWILSPLLLVGGIFAYMWWSKTSGEDNSVNKGTGASDAPASPRPSSSYESGGGEG